MSSILPNASRHAGEAEYVHPKLGRSLYRRNTYADLEGFWWRVAAASCPFSIGLLAIWFGWLSVNLFERARP